MVERRESGGAGSIPAVDDWVSVAEQITAPDFSPADLFDVSQI
jgi:hypothetical protein